MLSKMHSKASNPSSSRTKMRLPGTIVFLLSVRPCSNNALQLPAHRTAAHIPLHNGRSQSFVCAPGDWGFFLLWGNYFETSKVFPKSLREKAIAKSVSGEKVEQSSWCPVSAAPKRFFAPKNLEWTLPEAVLERPGTNNLWNLMSITRLFTNENNEPIRGCLMLIADTQLMCVMTYRTWHANAWVQSDTLTDKLSLMSTQAYSWFLLAVNSACQMTLFQSPTLMTETQLKSAHVHIWDDQMWDSQQLLDQSHAWWHFVEHPTLDHSLGNDIFCRW